MDGIGCWYVELGCADGVTITCMGERRFLVSCGLRTLASSLIPIPLSPSDGEK